MEFMKNKKTLKRAASAVVAAALMTSAVSAQVVYEQDFDNVTQYDLFGNVFNYTGTDTNFIQYLFAGETITNEDGSTTLKAKDHGTGELKINDDILQSTDQGKADAVSFFSIEDGKGVITKVGTRYNGNKFGFRKNLSEEIAALNAAQEPEEEITEISEEETSAAVDNVIKSGVWNFDFTFQSTTEFQRYLVFRNGNAEKLAVKITKWANGMIVSNAMGTGTALGNAYVDNTGANFGHALAWGTGTENTLRFQLDFDKNTLQVYRYFGNKWKQITRIPQYGEDGTTITGYDDESGIKLSDFNVDLSAGIDSFGYEEAFHANPCKTIFDDIKVSKATDDTELWKCDFSDETKDSWWDYGFENSSQYTTAWVEDGKLNYIASQYRNTTIDKTLDEPANSGVWAVSVKYWSDTTNTDKAPVPGQVYSTAPRNFINFLNDEHGTYDMTQNPIVSDVALGVSCGGSSYPHMWNVTEVNGESLITQKEMDDGNKVQAGDFLNPDCKKMPDENGKRGSMSSTPKTGAEYKIVIDFNALKMYMYAKVDYNRGYWVVVNPEGYDLPEGFNFNKIRFYDYNPSDRIYAAWDYIKIEKFDSTNDVLLTATGDDGGYIGKDDTLKIAVESYRAPSEESKTTYIDKSQVNVAAAVYDGNKLVDLKFIPNVQYSAFETFDGNVKFDEIGNGNTVKIFAVDPTNLRPLSGVKTLDGISFD